MHGRSLGNAEWIVRMRTARVLDVAKGLGLDVQPPRGAGGGSFSCPVCNAQRRHTKTRDKRGAAGVRNDGRGWRCFQCDASGDAIDIVAFHLRGEHLSKLASSGKAEVREWCGRWLGLSGSLPNTQRVPRRIELPKPPRYPPIDEVRALWAAAERVDADIDVTHWLASDRGLDAGAIVDLDLVRALPRSADSLPDWAGFGGQNDKPWRSWPSAGLRLVVPLHDADGAMRSVLFRRPFETSDEWPPKSVGASGVERAGLVMANAVACHLLAHPIARADGMSIVIEEGETDWLTGCLAWARANERAIFGVTSGSWTSEIAQRVPRGARVTIRTDNDDAGDLLAIKIASTLRDRCTVLRGGKG